MILYLLTYLTVTLSGRHPQKKIIDKVLFFGKCRHLGFIETPFLNSLQYFIFYDQDFIMVLFNRAPVPDRYYRSFR